MNTKLFFSAGVGAALLIFVFSSFVSPASGYSEPIIKEVSYFGEDFGPGSGDGFAISAAGLSLQADAFTTIYTSPEIKAPIPFNAVVPQWLVDLPEDGTFELFIRTKPDGSQAGELSWSEWTDVHTHEDWTSPDEPLQVGDMLTVPETDGRHTHLQYRLVMGRYNADTAVTLNRLTFTFIDSTAGPTVAEMMAQQQAIDTQKANRPANGSYPRPSIISRQVWCLSDDCDYSEGLEYQNASHMVIHHTVSSNDSADWAATVRAIWSFHTYSREWGDIGYNYLVDQDGIIYEGHLNEDYETLDVAGTHAAGANRGGMGVALLGTFTEPEHTIPGIEPPAVMIDSLVDLLSWKADQRQIDVFDATDSLPDVSHGLPHLMGHRDVYGTTACPGDQAHSLIPMLIDRVAQNIDLINPYIMVDEQGNNATFGGGGWVDGPDECGTFGHSYLTNSTMDPNSVSQWAVWRPTIPEAGTYRIEVRVPYCYTGKAETSGAVYEVNHALGTNNILIDQNARVGDWISLGVFKLSAGTDNSVFLTNLTETDAGLGLWFDDMRLIAAEPKVETAVPSTADWVNQQTVQFEWSANFVNSLTTTLQISHSPNFSEPVFTTSWSNNPVTYTHTFAADDSTLYWQVSTIMSETNALVTSPAAQFGIDTAVPTSQVTTLMQFDPSTYRLHWTGSDEGSGIAGYNLAYRSVTTTTWTPWLTGTLQTFADFNPPDPEQQYELQVQAFDFAGNMQPEEAAAVNTIEAINLPHAIMLPLIIRE